MAVATYHVCADGRCVLQVEVRPGTLHSTAAPPPGWKPPAHPFIHGVSIDPLHEHTLGQLLRQSDSAAGYLRRVVDAGYDLVDGAVDRWDLEGGHRRLYDKATDELLGVVFPTAGPLVALGEQRQDDPPSFGHACGCAYVERALPILASALAETKRFEELLTRLRAAGLVPRFR